MAITTEEDAAKKGTEMGRKFIVPYGLYRAEGFISANLARKTTGFDEDDLALLWKAILNMFENDRSAARGMMAVRKLIIFKHDSELAKPPRGSCSNSWMFSVNLRLPLLVVLRIISLTLIRIICRRA